MTNNCQEYDFSMESLLLRCIKPILLCSKDTHLTLSGPAFSVVRQARGGGSEAQMPKIKVNINWLKLNFAWVIMSIKAFLMQNLRLIALLVLEIWRHKIYLKRRERFDYLPPENGFIFKKRVFMSRIVLLDPKLTPMSIPTIFN